MSQADARLDLRDRSRLFAALEADVFDLAVIGGGITGAGIARDAAMRGLSVALVEARDFASGTSSRSSKMVHGGLRYLAQGDLSLVREAARERKAVEAIAPHLARETPFVIPARSAAGIARLKAALWTFEKLGAVPKSRRHRVWSKKELSECEPALKTEGLAGAVVYPEFLTDDSRLTLANVRSAAAAGAVIVSRARVDSLLLESGRVTGVMASESLAGATARCSRLRARVVVNAAGPWADEIRAMEAPDAEAMLELSGGIHLVVPRNRLPIDRTLVLQAADRRGIFAVPRNEVCYIGTTDIFAPGPDAWPRVDPDQVAYLLAAAAANLTIPPLGPKDVVSVWAGARPLIAQPGRSPSEISRKDELLRGPGGMLSIAGGKLTAYRAMAERVVDQVEAILSRRTTRCRTATAPLPGGEREFSTILAELARLSLDGGEADRLARLYGTEASELLAEGGGPAAEGRRAVLVEGALGLEDWWVRRSGRAWFDLDAGTGALAMAAEAMAPLLAWSKEETAAQIEACRQVHERDMASVRAAPVRTR